MAKLKSFFSSKHWKKKTKNQYSHPKSDLEPTPTVGLNALPFSTHQKKPKNQYSRPKPIPEPIPLHLRTSFSSPSIISLKSQQAKIHKNYRCLRGNCSLCPKKVQAKALDVEKCLVILQRPLLLTRLWGCNSAVSCCRCKAWASLKRTP